MWNTSNRWQWMVKFQVQIYNDTPAQNNERGLITFTKVQIMTLLVKHVQQSIVLNWVIIYFNPTFLMIVAHFCRYCVHYNSWCNCVACCISNSNGTADSEIQVQRPVQMWGYRYFRYPLPTLHINIHTQLGWLKPYMSTRWSRGKNINMPKFE